jgi:hypothetical protein
MEMAREWAMPSRWTFTIPPIKRLLDDEFSDGRWCDPFAGQMSFHSSAYSNDISPETPARFHEDALQFLRRWDDNSFDGVLYDPPYSITQAAKYGSGYHSLAYWSQCKDEIARITKLGGKVICFGWTSMGLGVKRGFEMRRILLVPHGGSKNDTIVTVERKNRCGDVDGRRRRESAFRTHSSHCL